MKTQMKMPILCVLGLVLFFTVFLVNPVNAAEPIRFWKITCTYDISTSQPVLIKVTCEPGGGRVCTCDENPD
jgi:hypothetical protein